MKRGGLLIGVGAVLIAASCVNPFAGLDRFGTGGSAGRVTVSTNLTSARTVVPDFSTAIDSFEVVLTSHDGYDAKTAMVTLPAIAHTFDSIQTGTWDIAVTAKKGGVTVGSGSAFDQTIEAGTTHSVVVPVSFIQSSGTGSLALAISFPSSETGVDYVEGLIDGTTIVPILSPNGASLEGTFAQTNLAAGAHDLVMTFKRGGSTGTVAAVFTEAVNIWANLTSDRWIDENGQAVAVRGFTEADFFNATASLSSLQISAGSITFVPSTYVYNGGTITDPKVTLSATGTVAGQYLEYRLNGGAWIELQPGVGSAPVSLNAGANTIDVRVTAPDRATTKSYTVVVQRTLTIDHTNFDPSTLSDAEVARAAQLNVYFEHASVGGNIFSDPTNGFDLLTSMNSRYSSGHVHWDIGGDLPGTPPDAEWYAAHQDVADWFTSNRGLADVYRGNPGAEAKQSVFENSMEWASLAGHLDVASFKYCWIDTPSITSGTPDGPTMFEQTKAEMEALENANPGIVLLWWTVPLQSTEAYPDRQTYNDLVRSYCAQNGKWLLDIADLESHDDSGDLYAMDVAGQALEIIFTDYTYDGGHLTSEGKVKIAEAYWKLIGEIAKTR